LRVELEERHSVRPAKPSAPEAGLDDDMGVPEHTPWAAVASKRDLVEERAPAVERREKHPRKVDLNECRFRPSLEVCRVGMNG